MFSWVLKNLWLVFRCLSNIVSLKSGNRFTSFGCLAVGWGSSLLISMKSLGSEWNDNTYKTLDNKLSRNSVTLVHSLCAWTFVVVLSSDTNYLFRGKVLNTLSIKDRILIREKVLTNSKKKVLYSRKGSHKSKKKMLYSRKSSHQNQRRNYYIREKVLNKIQKEYYYIREKVLNKFKKNIIILEKKFSTKFEKQLLLFEKKFSHI